MEERQKEQQKKKQKEIANTLITMVEQGHTTIEEAARILEERGELKS